MIEILHIKKHLLYKKDISKHEYITHYTGELQR